MVPESEAHNPEDEITDKSQRSWPASWCANS
jgi:hypothetical protein